MKKLLFAIIFSFIFSLPSSHVFAQDWFPGTIRSTIRQQRQEQKKNILLVICKKQEQRISVYYNKILVLNKEFEKLNKSNNKFIAYEKELRVLIWEYKILSSDIKNTILDGSQWERLKNMIIKTKGTIQKIKSEIQYIKNLKKS